MKASLAKLALGATLLVSPLATALSAADIPADTPVAQLIQSAKTQLAAGNPQDALLYFDVAISRDPQNYLTIFNRGAAYLSLGKSQQARRDFDKVLQFKPGFEGALIQRAKIRARHGEWVEAEEDYQAAGKKADSQEIHELNEAHGSAVMAETAAKEGKWEQCVQDAGVAIMVASSSADLRNLRAKCRFERGEIIEGVSDLQHVLSIASGSTEPHLKISTLQFFALGETEQGLAQVRKCLHSDPESKSCKKLLKREKALAKSLKKLNQLVEKKQFAGASKVLTKQGDEPGLLQEVKDDFEQHKKEGLIHQNSQSGLYISLVEQTCQAYIEMNSIKRGQKYCVEALQLDPNSLWGLLAQAKRQLESEDFEAAIASLNTAKESHGNNDKIQKLMNEAQTLLKRSKQKDYYKVLDVPRDADQRDIKKSFRRLTLKFHPDKAAAQGLPKEEAEKKMAAINEAYEVLSDPELRARFDRGDDPNDPQQNQGNPFTGSPFGGQQFVFKQGGSHFQFQGGFPGGFPGGFHFGGH